MILMTRFPKAVMVSIRSEASRAVMIIFDRCHRLGDIKSYVPHDPVNLKCLETGRDFAIMTSPCCLVGVRMSEVDDVGFNARADQQDIGLGIPFYFSRPPCLWVVGTSWGKLNGPRSNINH